MLILKNISLINIGHICILYYSAAGHDRSDDELRQFPLSLQAAKCERGKKGLCAPVRAMWVINKGVT